MLKRKVYDKLIEWKNRNHKCLVVTGQRQVGKTYIIDAFAKSEYRNYIYINFNETPEKSELFNGNIDIEELLRKFALNYGTDSVQEGNTLIFLDEIQDCLRAYSSLKTFTKYGKIDVIASGSLLGVKMPTADDEKEPLIPMGYEEQIVMGPMDFEEFLWAMDFPPKEIEGLRDSIRNKTAIDETVLKRTEELYRQYLIVGGMPEAVDTYTKAKDFRPVNNVHSEILNSCLRDINRYNRNGDRIRTTECFESIAPQLADTNKKFMYSRISGGSSRKSSDKYMENLLWIKDAGYGLFCYGLEKPALPLEKYKKRDVFKVYLSDTGLLLKMYGDKARLAIYNGDNEYNNGAIMEDAVACGLHKCGYPLAYYKKDKGEGKMEMDFILEFWSGVVAVEVKSGSNISSNSLDKIGKKFSISRRIKLHDVNICVDEDSVEHYPLFASSFIEELDAKPDGPKFS